MANAWADAFLVDTFSQFILIVLAVVGNIQSENWLKLKKKRNKCKQCDKSFFSTHELKLHIDSVHDKEAIKPKPFQCDSCNMCFPGAAELGAQGAHLRTQCLGHQLLEYRFCEPNIWALFYELRTQY